MREKGVSVCFKGWLFLGVKNEHMFDLAVVFRKQKKSISEKREQTLEALQQVVSEQKQLEYKEK